MLAFRAKCYDDTRKRCLWRVAESGFILFKHFFCRHCCVLVNVYYLTSQSFLLRARRYSYSDIASGRVEKAFLMIRQFGGHTALRGCRPF